MKISIEHQDILDTKEPNLLPVIRGFRESTLIDWEGRIACIIFLGGCNFRCGFCHSKSLVENDDTESIPFDIIAGFLKEKKDWIYGVVITGGEPTIYGRGLIGLIKDIKDLGFHVKLDTNGINPGLLEKIFKNRTVDYIAMDIKAPLRQERYCDIAGVGVDIDVIIKSKDIIIDSGIDYEFRTTLIPGLISASDVEEIARSLVPAKRYRLQQFRSKDTLDESFLKLKPLPEESLAKLAQIAQEYIPDTKFRK